MSQVRVPVVKFLALFQNNKYYIYFKVYAKGQLYIQTYDNASYNGKKDITRFVQSMKIHLKYKAAGS